MATLTGSGEMASTPVDEPRSKDPIKEGGMKRNQSHKEEEEEEGEDNDDGDDGSTVQNNLQQQQQHRTKKNRRRGKGKTKKLPQPPELSFAIDPLKQQIARKVAEEQVQQIVTKGFLAACWSLGIVLPQHATPRNSPTRFTFDTHVGSAGNRIYPPPIGPSGFPGEYYDDHDHLLFGRAGPSGVNWEGTLMSIVDRAAHDPVTMESLVQDLALALPEISMEIQHHNQDEDYYGNGWEFGSHAYAGGHDALYVTGAEVSQPIPPPPGFSLDPEMHASTSYIDLLLQSPHMSKHTVGTSGSQQQPKHRSSRAKMWGSSSSLASLSLAVASAAVEDETDRVLMQSDDESDEEPALYKAWDPDRAARVALVTELAEKERHRRIAEREELTWKDRLNRAARIEWAVLASEAERQRRALADAAKMEREQRIQRLKQQVLEEESERRRRASSVATTATAAVSTLDESGMSLLNVSGVSMESNISGATSSPAAPSPSSAPLSPPLLPTPTAQPQSAHAQPLYVQDYEVICPYSVLGCDATLRRSELPQHFVTCPFRAEVIEAKRLALLKETYNPLDHVVVCPYTVVGCTYSCRRADLPAHLQVCPLKMERNLSLPSMIYEVVCPYTPLGCTVTCLRSQIGFHLQECPFRPRSRQEEDQERESNRQYAIEVEEQERSRRVASPRERLTSMDSKTRGLVLEAIVANPAPRPQPSSKPQPVTAPKPPTPPQPITAFTAAVQHRHRAMSMDKQHQSRDRTGSVSVPLPHTSTLVGGIPALDLSQGGPISPVISPASAAAPVQPAAPKEDDEDLARSRRVSWVVQAAEIERMRKAEEKIALLSNQTTPSASSSSSTVVPPKTPPMSPNRKVVLQRFQSGGGEESESPPGRKRIVLEAALRRQRLHHARWFPAESLEFQGRRTHVYSFHNHMEQQTRHLHRALHDEIERFGRDCALWELSCQASVNALMEKIRGVVESTWIKFIATTPPTLHMFGSFASELSVPGVSDLDLVVVPGAIPAEQLASPSSTSVPHQQSPPTSTAPTSLQRSNSLTQQQQQAQQQQATTVPISRSASMPPQPPATSTRRASFSSIPPLPPHHSPMVMHTRKTVLGEGMTSPTRSSSTPSPSDHRKLPSPSFGPQPTSKPRRSGSIDSNASNSFIGVSSSSSSQTNFARLRSRSIPDANSSETHMRNLMRDRLEAARRCRILGESLMQCDFLQNVRVIDTASVPVINMRTSDVSPRLDIDLTVALTNHDGLAAAEFVKMLRTRFPPLMPMVRLLKAFLHSRGLANPFHGGLPSYALVLMATCSVIRSCDRVGPRQACFLSQGELVVDFLDLFGREFDPRTEAVCCNWKADLDKLGIGRAVTTELPLLYISTRSNSLSGSLPHQQEVTLVVDDPIRFGNNVGRSSFAFAQVQQSFAEVLASLLSHVVKNEALGRSSASANATSNSSLLERVFGVKPFSQPGQDSAGASKKS